MTTVDMVEEKLGINRYNYSGTLKQVDTLWHILRKDENDWVKKN